MYDFSQKTALILDDTPDSRAFLRNHLANLGFKSAPQFPTVKDALEKLPIIKPDVIICDYYLGDDIDGQQFLEYLRNNNLIDSSVAFVMVTAEAGYAKVASAAEFSPDVYLLKPFSGEALEQRLILALERRETLTPISQLMNIGAWEDAIQLIEEKMKADSNFRSQLMKMRGECLENINIDAAFDFYSLVSRKGIPWALTGLARCNIIKNEVDEAKSILSSMVDSGSLFIEAYDLLSNISTPEEAVAINQQSAAVIPSSNRFRKVAKAAITAGQYDLAEKFYDSVISKNKYGFNVSVEDRVGRIKAIAGNGKVAEAAEALKTLKDSIEASGSSALSQSELNELSSAEVSIMIQSKDHNAKDSLLKAMQAESMTADQAIELARLGHEAGLIEEASDLLARFLANNTNSQNAKIALKSSSFGDEFEDLIKKADSNISSINNAALSLVRSGNLEDAFAMLDRMASQYHGNPSILLNAARVGLEIIKTGKATDDLSRRAIAHLRTGLRNDPGNILGKNLQASYRTHGFSI